MAGDAPAVRAVVFAVLEEYGLSPSPASTDKDLDDIIASYGGRGGLFRVIASPTGAVVGCGGLYPIDSTEVEIRKMYLLKEARGRGLGRMLLNDLIAAARERGFERVVAETASVLREAIGNLGDAWPAGYFVFVVVFCFCFCFSKKKKNFFVAS